MKVFRLAAFILLLSPAANLRAGEIYEMYRGARAQAMGNAYVGLADDEQAIFLNPAGLAGNKKYTFNYAAADIALSSDLLTAYQSGAEAFGSFSGDSLNVLMGKDIYGQVQLAPSLMMPNFGVAVLMDGLIALSTENRAMPQLTLGYQTTNGIQFAYGVTLGKGFRQKSEFRVGVGGKVMWRRGGHHELQVLDILTMSQAKLKEITGNYGRGLGLDLGTQYVYRPNKRLTLSAGLAYTDIGDTNFGSGPEPVKGNLSWGLAGEYNLGRAKAILTFDHHHLLDQTDWRKKNHIGTEISLPFISLYGGINQVYFTYGAAFDIWLLKLTLYSYVTELGSFVFQNPERRWVLKIALKFDL